MEMKKIDLNTGDIVKFKNGNYFIYTGEKLYFGDDDDLAPVNVNNVVEIKRPSQEEVKEFGEKVKNTIWKKEAPNMWGDMTYAEAHKKMFMAIANGEVATKTEWLEKTDPSLTLSYLELENSCFACEEAKRRREKANKDNEFYATKDDHKLAVFRFNDSICNYCPLGGLGKNRKCLNGLYDEYINSKGFEKFKLAYEIANLEWKEVDK